MYLLEIKNSKSNKKKGAKGSSVTNLDEQLKEINKL